ncbi:hypothetical protein GOBAR_DD23405 [Gossypium barbadense]|nr:hypothetical protein GOBAR_DD23405 [Gossypium barbadense]
MTESGANDGFGGDEVSLLAEELIQLSVKSSVVEPNEKPTLICTIWTEKSYNQDSFKAQMKSIWKTKKKFEIQSVGQNLFVIVFELEEDLETIMEGQPWLFRKSLVIFDRLTKPMERDQIRLVSSLFWIKIGPSLPGKKQQPQSSYTRGIKENQEAYLYSGKSSGLIQEVQEDSWATITGTETRMQQEGEHDRNKSERSKIDEELIKPVRKSS